MDHPYLVSNLRKKQTHSVDCCNQYSIDIFVRNEVVEPVPLYFQDAESLNCERSLNFIKLFFCINKIIMTFSLFCNVLKCIDDFLGPVSHPASSVNCCHIKPAFETLLSHLLKTSLWQNPFQVSILLVSNFCLPIFQHFLKVLNTKRI